jgi:ribosomal-protein-alanine N-acetyltransferase
MLSTSDWTVRPALPADRERILELLARAPWRHQHLDWIGPADLLGEAPFLLGVRGRRLIGCLACPPDPPGVAWLRLVVASGDLNPQSLWDRLWPEAQRGAREAGVARFAALPIGDWLPPILRASGFVSTDTVVFLEWRGSRAPALTPARGRLRPFQSADLEAVFEVDRQAFGLIWQYSRPTLTAALAQAAVATVLEERGRIIGYQICTASALGAHLARLAIVPEEQRQGLGRALVADALQTLTAQGFDRVTVNTQGDNRIAQTLYVRLGFNETGQNYPVYEIATGAGPEDAAAASASGA